MHRPLFIFPLRLIAAVRSGQIGRSTGIHEIIFLKAK